jgi:hypothetical protein
MVHTTDSIAKKKSSAAVEGVYNKFLPRGRILGRNPDKKSSGFSS